MALRGNLKDFSLPDVFQLVQLSGKTGVLRIVRADTEGSIWFRDGDVFFARSNWRHELLGERLVTAQRITPAALSRTLDLYASEGGARRLGEILVGEGYITQQVLETFVQEQIEDTIFDIMRWDEGDFDFETLPDVVHEDIGLSVSVENIVMEGSRRLEEWNRIKKKVPSADMVFKMATAPGEGTFEISLKPIEWNLLLLIDGTRSVRDLALEVHSTDFEVARVIYGLFSAGLLEVPSDDEVASLRAERAAREAKRADAQAAAAAAGQVAEPSSESVQDSTVGEPEPAIETAVAAESGPETAPESVPEAPVDAAPEAAAEVPEFLSVGTDAPSDDDMAVFAEMMEAVLLPQGVAPDEGAAIVTQEEPVLEAPVAQSVSDASDMLDQWADSMFPAEVAGGAGPVETDIEPSTEPPDSVSSSEAPGIDGPVLPELASPSAADMDEIPAAAVIEVAPLPEGFVSTGDFETDLRTLGLGEYPSELLAEETGPADEPQLTPQPEPGSESGPEFEPAPTLDFTQEPEPLPEPVAESQGSMSGFDTGSFFFETGTGSGIAPEIIPDVSSEVAPYAPAVDLDGTEDWASFVDSVSLSESAAGSSIAGDFIEDAGVADEEAADGESLDSLLQSLTPPADPAAGIISSDTDFGAEDQAGGYISTDSYLAEFDTGAGLGGGLGDELTALTGGGSVRTRPVATVSAIPEPGEGGKLRIDHMVDRELLEKIIKGVEDL